jgi:hypothetical protein
MREEVWYESGDAGIDLAWGNVVTMRFDPALRDTRQAFW